jgi:ribosomal protein S18 acetylase RimI-like enzyme
MVSLRPATREDDALVHRVYESTRAAEFQRIGWSDAQLALFLKMQHDARQRGYAAQFPAAELSIVVDGEEPAGTLQVERASEAIRLIDIAIFPERRGAGIGAFLIKELQAEAAKAGIPVRLQVALGNPAQRLYQRLGFVRTGGGEVHEAMEWRPPAP